MDGVTTLEGIAGIPGKAAGKAYVYERTLVASSDRAPGDRVAEINLLRGTIERAMTDLLALEAAVRRGPAPEAAAIFQALHSVLEDDAFVGDAIQRIETEGESASSAIAATAEKFSGIFSQTDDPLHRGRAEEFHEASMMVSRLLAGKPTSPWPDLPEESVVIARDLTLMELAAAPRDRLVGIVLAGGSGESAVLDLARRLGLPVGLGFGSSLEGIRTGDQVTLEVSSKAVLVIGSSDNPGSTGAGEVRSVRDPTHGSLATFDGNPIIFRIEAPWGVFPSASNETVWLLPPDFDPDRAGSRADLPRWTAGQAPRLVLSPGDDVNLAPLIARFPSGYHIGIAVERPGLAAAADLLAKRADFLHLNPGALGRACGGVLHPGNLRLIQHVVRCARKVRTPVQIGGEAALDPILLPLWLGLEITEWSLPEQAARDFCAHIRAIPLAWARRIGTEALRLSKAEDIARYLEESIASRKTLRVLLRSSSGS